MFLGLVSPQPRRHGASSCGTPRAPALPESQVASSSRVTSGNRSEGQRPDPAARAGGGEAATPGQPVRFRILEVPRRQFALTDHRPPLALPQLSGKLRNSHVSLKTLLSRCSQLAIEKRRTIVQNLWTIKLACGKQRKTKNQNLCWTQPEFVTVGPTFSPKVDVGLKTSFSDSLQNPRRNPAVRSIQFTKLDLSAVCARGTTYPWT